MTLAEGKGGENTFTFTQTGQSQMGLEKVAAETSWLHWRNQPENGKADGSSVRFIQCAKGVRCEGCVKSGQGRYHQKTCYCERSK